MNLDEVGWLRRLTLQLLKLAAPKRIRIRHHWTRTPFLLDPYRHRNYWWRRHAREVEETKVVRALVRPGGSCIDVGGHIGYVTLLLAELVGPEGSVVVYEPGPNNLPFLVENVKRLGNVTVRPVALGARCERRVLYVENLSGQNNSLVPDYAILLENARASHLRARVEERAVDVVTLDAESQQFRRPVAFIKIDAEGYECEILQGAVGLLREDLPALMVEVTMHAAQIFGLLEELGYLAFSDHGHRIGPADGIHGRNRFFLHPSRQAESITALGWPLG